jgi:hypothetical protein
MTSSEKTPLVKVLMKLNQEALKLKENHSILLNMNKNVYRLGKDIRETNDAMEIANGFRKLNQ